MASPLRPAGIFLQSSSQFSNVNDFSDLLMCPLFCIRFMPGNNNLVVTVCHSLIYILNVSTGKFTGATCSLIQGRTLSIEINELGTLMWVGNDRGYIEVKYLGVVFTSDEIGLCLTKLFRKISVFSLGI